jgi:hypothetical protein
MQPKFIEVGGVILNLAAIEAVRFGGSAPPEACAEAHAQVNFASGAVFDFAGPEALALKRFFSPAGPVLQENPPRPE